MSNQVTPSRAQLDHEFARFLLDFGQESSDRAAIILGAAKLDSLLGQLLQRALLPCPTSNDGLIFGDGPLKEFSARIEMLHRMGLIDANLAKALHLIRNIRNKVAHGFSSGLADGADSDRVRALVACFTQESFKSFGSDLGLPTHAPISRDFRAALMLCCALLDIAVCETRPLPLPRVWTLSMFDTIVDPTGPQ